MIQFIYNPNVLNSFLSIAYCVIDDLVEDNNSRFQKELGIIYHPHPYNSTTTYVNDYQKENLIYLVFDHKIGNWLCYHRNFYWGSAKTTKMIVNTRTLYRFLYSLDISGDIIRTNKYFGVTVKNGNYIEFINIIDENNNVIPIHKNPYRTSEVDFSNPSLCQNFQYRNFIVPCKTGLMHINSFSYIDMIFSTMRLGKTSNHIKELATVLSSDTYLKVLNPMFETLVNHFNQIQLFRPKSEYSIIYQLFNKNDKEYYDTKMQKFQKNVMDLFSQIKSFESGISNNIGIFIANFIGSFKFDLALELSIVYHRWIHFPSEKKKLFQAFPNHPYFKLLKMVQSYYKRNTKPRRFIGINDIFKMFDKNDMITNDEITTTIIEAVSRRSELFVFSYGLYFDTIANNIKPKYKTKYNYFPFKIFSPSLFCMDNILTVYFADNSY